MELKQTKELVAYHEAGHAAMIVLFSDIALVTHLTNLPDDKKAAGKCKYVHLRKGRITKREQLADALIALGGPFAQERFCGHSLGRDGDMDDFFSFMQKWDLSAEQGNHLFDIVRIVIDDHWELVESIAKILIEKEMIDAEFFFFKISRPYLKTMTPDTYKKYIIFTCKFEDELKRIKRTRKPA